MITSETRAGSTPARSSAALMATAPRSWAGVVANAPLKLPTGVRAALTMTTSSDMDISWGLRFLEGGRPDGGPVSHLILLTELMHVNAAGHSKTARKAFSRKSGWRFPVGKCPPSEWRGPPQDPHPVFADQLSTPSGGY